MNYVAEKTGERIDELRTELRDGLSSLRGELRGDQIYLECHWDNSAENQALVEGQPLPPRDVTWGEGTTDEMCLSGFYFTRL